MHLPRPSFFARSANARPLSTTPEVAVRSVADQLGQLARQIGHQDNIFQKQARFRLEQMARQVDELLRQELSFSQTETWRTLYESVLSSCKAKRYLSVALVEHEDYWQDQPAKASLEFNYDLVRHGFHVHRRFIIDDFFWPPGAIGPANEILGSIEEQATHGIEVSLIRKSALEAEPGLICDFGIYGEIAVGHQSLDEQARTTSYVLRFGRSAVEAAEELWRQLDLYAIPLDEILDRLA